MFLFDEATDSSGQTSTFVEQRLFQFQAGAGPVTFNAGCSITGGGPHEEDPSLPVTASTLG